MGQICATYHRGELQNRENMWNKWSQIDETHKTKGIERKGDNNVIR